MKQNTTYFETQHETCIKNLWKTTTKNIKMKLTPFLTETVTTQEMKIDTETIKAHQKDKKNQPESDNQNQNHFAQNCPVTKRTRHKQHKLKNYFQNQEIQLYLIVNQRKLLLENHG